MESLSQIRDIVAVHSGKGGVGKSTTTAHLAVAFSKLGLSVGVLDADVHGPSMALAFGDDSMPRESANAGMARPLSRHGVQFLSLANVASDSAPIIWRGPMVAGALNQLLSGVDWGELDLLLIDMPPGTGDALLSLGQSVTLSGVVVVSTPQEMSLADTRRGVQAFAALSVPVLGMVENMSGFVCDHCGDEVPLFGAGGAHQAATDLGIPFLGRIPLVPAVRAATDAGEPLNHTEPEGHVARAYSSLARNVITRLAIEGKSGSFHVDWKDSAPDQRDPPRPVLDEGTPLPHVALTIWQASERELAIRWGDGTTTFHDAYALRRACPCAACVDEWTGEKLPSLDEVPKEVRPRTIQSVGRYAIQPVWSDGHQTGIFTFRDLKSGVGQTP